MGTDHSKYNTLTIKIPDPAIAFPNFQNEGNLRWKYEKEIQQLVWGSTQVELPPNYWISVRKIFSFLDKSYAIMLDNILKCSTPSEAEDHWIYLAGLETHAGILKKSFERLPQDAVPDDERTTAINEGLRAGHNILERFADRNGVLFQKYFLTSPFLVMTSTIYRCFSNIWAMGQDYQSRQWKEMERLGNILELYKVKCIQERLENIKMLRHQSEEYKVNDYSHEAQGRKDVTFGGVVTDYYDKRPRDQIPFSPEHFADPNDAEKILSRYKTSVKMEYELFFDAVLGESQLNEGSLTSTYP